MTADSSANVSFEYGTMGDAGVPGIFVIQETKVGSPDSASNYQPDGTITLYVPKSAIGNPQPGDLLGAVGGRTFTGDTPATKTTERSNLFVDHTFVKAQADNSYPPSTYMLAPPPIQATVQTNPVGRSFSVDGSNYTTSQTFSWTPGSSHIIGTTSPQNGGTGVRYAWSNWSGGGAISHTVAPTKNTTYTANFTTQYYLTMSRGTGGTTNPTSGWRNSGATVSITATPATGYKFTSWSGTGTGSFSGTSNPASITMSGPITETAAFTKSP